MMRTWQGDCEDLTGPARPRELLSKLADAYHTLVVLGDIRVISDTRLLDFEFLGLAGPRFTLLLFVVLLIQVNSPIDKCIAFPKPGGLTVLMQLFTCMSSPSR